MPGRVLPGGDGKKKIGMRKSKDETAETRRRIVVAAAAEFRRRGIAETGLADLMATAGLTHGGFYRHFSSKDQLVSEACAAALDTMAKSIAGEAKSNSPGLGLQAIVRKYLRPAHRENPAKGCALAAMGSELGRADKKTRQTAADGYFRLVKMVAGQITGLPAEEAEQQAIALVSAMIGAITISRFIDDKEAANKVLHATGDYLLKDERPPV